MAANMPQMAGPGQMIPQQKAPHGVQLNHYVIETLRASAPPMNGMTWQSGVAISERLAKTMQLITNIMCCQTNPEPMRAAEFGCNFEREVFQRVPSKVLSSPFLSCLLALPCL
jgi:hypothetical protein